MTDLIKPLNGLTKGIDVHFVFHNIGQGLFYSGKVGSFNFIYDCGVEKEGINRLNLMVSAYKWDEEVHRKMFLDLLILSHLHIDHISGLKELFNNGTRVNAAILPYLTPVERTMVALQSGAVPDWLYDFWADPVAFLIENGVGRVILIGGEEGMPPSDSEDREEPPPESGPESDQSPRRIDYDSLQDDNKLKMKVISNDPQLQKLVDEKKLLIKNHNKNLRVMGIWFFRFFNYKLEDEQQKTFEACIRNNCDFSDLQSVIKNKSMLEKLRFCYKILQGDFNDTSLIVYHAPIINPTKLENMKYEHKSALSKGILGNWLFSNLELTVPDYSETQIGHFLTGDINLNLKYDEIKKHFEKYFSRIGVALIPHHGSIKNWDNILSSEISLANSNATVWVASAGINSKYGHPDLSVIQDISRLGVPFYCNEAHGLRIYAHLET